MLAFALRSLWRELRSGELKVLLWGLIVGVAAFASVGLFTDRIRLAMEQQASEMLAADLVLEARSPFPEAWRAEAEGRGLSTTRLQEFRSVVMGDERLQLTEIKALAPGYPLRGELRIGADPFAAGARAQGPPPRGEVWVEHRLLQRLGLALGDSVQVGQSQMSLSGLIRFEPDRGGNFFNIAPRVMMNSADLEATGLIGVGSRVEYRLLLAGERAAINAFRDWIQPKLRQGDQLLGRQDSGRQLSTALERAERFLGLASLVALMLAAVGIAMAAHRYARRHRDASAVLRCLGASRNRVAGVFLVQLLVLGLVGSLLGALAGYAAQFGLGLILADLFDRALPQPSLIPIGRGLLAGLITLAGFALPPLLALRNTPPLRVLRSDLPAPRLGLLAGYGPAAAALLALMGWQAQDWQLTLMVFGGSLAALLVMALAAWALVLGLRRLDLRGGISWRYGLANIPRRAEISVLQMVAFGLGLTVLLLLSLVRTDLLTTWRDSLPPDAPNHFLINVQPDQIEPLKAFFAEREQKPPAFHPMVRGRLTHINGQAIAPEDYPEGRPQRLVRREFNLSWAAEPYAHNQIVKGDWWQAPPEDVQQWSVETGIADTLGIAMGDELRYEVAGQSFEGVVTNLRTVQWDSFKVNFFVVGPPGLLPPGQASFITAFHLPEGRGELMVGLIKQFPNITDIDVNALMQRVRLIIDRVILSVEFVSVFTLLAGLVVLYAGIQNSLDERLRETAILRTLGAVKRQIRSALAAEFLALGALAGLLAALTAWAVGSVLAFQLFELPYAANPWLWPAGILAGTLGMGLAGLWGTRSVIRQPPLTSLRQN